MTILKELLALHEAKKQADHSPLGQLKTLPQPIGINGGSYTYWVDVTKTPLKFTASDGSELDKAKSLEDVAKWMDKWAAKLWLEFLNDEESLEMLQGENIIRLKKGRTDQQDHETSMREGKQAQQFADTDEVSEYMEKLGSAADLWMSEPDLKKLMAHLNAGGKVKYLNVDASDNRDDRDAIFDKKVSAWVKKGWKLFASEWDGDEETADVILTSGGLNEAKEAGKKMQFPGVKVTMQQAWQRKLPAAVKALGYEVEMSGYDEQSTMWSVVFRMPKRFNIEKFEDKLRAELNVDGYMKVSEFDMVEED